MRGLDAPARRVRRTGSPAPLAIGVVAAALLAGCRDDPASFSLPAPPEAPEGPLRLTLSPFHDAGPAWLPDGREIAYSAGRSDLFPDAVGAIVALPAGGGQARALARPYQETVAFPHFTAPAISPDGSRIAVAELRITYPIFCGLGDTLDCGEDFTPSTIPAPELGLVALAVRSLDGSTSGPEHAIAFDGARRLEGSLLVLESDPYQRAYSRAGLPFRPSWSPDGRRLAFADGAALYLWTPGDGDPVPVPGTTLAVAPAWSPDGAMIAFTRLVGEPQQSFFCSCGEEFANRRVSEIAEERLELLDVASGAITDLGEPGRDPAWSPSGDALFVSRLGAIWRVPLANPAAATPVPSTTRGRHPAVSPDGTRLAFTLLDAAGLGDVWVVPLDATP
jgi:Tol biopolymer transport system component